MLIVVLGTVAVGLFFYLAARNAKAVPGKMQFAGEGVYGFVRNGIVGDTIGLREGKKFVPYLTTVFAFLCVLNVAGIIPLLQVPATSKIAFPLFLALISWATFNIVGIRRHGLGGYFKAMCFPPGVPKLVYYLAPPWMLLSGTFPIAHFDRTFLAIYLGFLLSLIVSYQVASRGRGRLLLDELFNMVSFFTLVRAVKRVLVGRGKPSRFEVTAKRGSGARDVRPILPHLALLLLSLLAISWSLMELGFGVSDDVFGAGTAIFWTLYNVALMAAVIRIGGRPAEQRSGCRFRANFAVERVNTTGTGTLGVTAA